MSKKIKSKHKQVAATAKPARVKLAPNPNAVTRAKRTWRERQMLRVTRAAGLLSRLEKAVINGKPPGVDAASLSQSLAHLAVVAPLIAALPNDFKAKRSSGGGGSDIGVGSMIGVKTEMEADPMFTHIPAALFEEGIVLDTDGLQNWLIKCADGVVRTIRKKFVELVSEDESTEEELLDDDAPAEDAE